MGMMTAQSSITVHPGAPSEPDLIPQLYAVLAIVEQIAPATINSVKIPDENALCRAFAQSPGIATIGFQTVASDTVAAVTVGAQALLGRGVDASAAAEELVRYLRRRIAQLGHFAGL